MHDNVVGLRGIAKDGDTIKLVMEYCQRGTLDRYLKETFGPGPSDRGQLVRLLPLLRHVARGVYHLHTRSPPVLHRDIKPSNIFISACCCCSCCGCQLRLWRSSCTTTHMHTQYVHNCDRSGTDCQSGGLWHESHIGGGGGRLCVGANAHNQRIWHTRLLRP